MLAGPVSGDQLLAFGVAAFILIVIPGPSVVFVIGRALAYGRGVALASVAGNSLGLLVVLVLVALGLGVVVAESVVVFTVLKLLGAAYLVFLGVQAVRHRRAYAADAGDAGGAADPDTRPAATGPAASPSPAPVPGAGPAPGRGPLPLGRAMRQGFVVGFSNPKAFMIFAAVLPQFVDRSAGHLQGQMLVLGLLAFGIGLLSDSVWAVLASQLRQWFSRSARCGEALGTVGGVSMIGLGVGLAVTGHQG